MNSPEKLPDKVVIYTDGSCPKNPGSGAWAFALMGKKERRLLYEASGTSDQTTCNRMEFTAAIKALKWVIETEVKEVLVKSDSELLVNTTTKWMFLWKKNGWKRNTGEIKNLDLIKELYDLTSKIPTTWQWVKAHNGSRWNEHVDKLAYKTATEQNPKPS